MTDTERLTEDERALLEAQKKAMPLPWWDESGVVHAAIPERPGAASHPASCEDEADAAYIVAAANAVPGLLDEIARAREALRQCEERHGKA